MTPPWEELAEAYARLAEAERGGCADDIALSLAEVGRAKEHLGALGGLLFLMMLDHGTDAVGARLSRLVADRTGPFCDKAAKAARLAKRVWDELDAVRARMRRLEEDVARLTPGVGEPTLRVVG